MPNDPRVKFRKKVYDPSRNIYYDYEPRIGGGGGSPFSGGGGGGYGPEPGPPGPGPGPPGPGPGPGPGPTPEPDINPDLNPGQIAGITLGSLAAAAALGYAAKKAADEIKARRAARYQPLGETELTDVNAPKPVPKSATQKAPKPPKAPSAATTAPAPAPAPTPAPKAPTPAPKDKSRAIKPDTGSSSYDAALFQEIQLRNFGRAGWLGPTGPVGIELPTMSEEKFNALYGDKLPTDPHNTPDEALALNDAIEAVSAEIEVLKRELADETKPQVK